MFGLLGTDAAEGPSCCEFRGTDVSLMWLPVGACTSASGTGGSGDHREALLQVGTEIAGGCAADAFAAALDNGLAGREGAVDRGLQPMSEELAWWARDPERQLVGSLVGLPQRCRCGTPFPTSVIGDLVGEKC